MRSGKLLAALALVLGAPVASLGLALMAGYIHGAVIAPRGQPDQSLLFWYLPILFLGVIALLIGVAAVVWGILRLRAIRRGRQG